MPKDGKNGKQQGAKAASTQTDDDFDDMLAEVCAADLVTSAFTEITEVAATAHVDASSTTSSSSSSAPPAAPTMGRRISGEVIIATCERGDITQLRRWGRQGVRVVSADPLCYCSYHGLPLDIMRCLVRELGADVNLANQQGGTPLILAVQTGNLATVHCLITELGADVNQADTVDGRTPTMMAVLSDQLEVLACLLGLGADVDKTNNKRSSPLSLARLWVAWLLYHAC